MRQPASTPISKIEYTDNLTVCEGERIRRGDRYSATVSWGRVTVLNNQKTKRKRGSRRVPFSWTQEAHPRPDVEGERYLRLPKYHRCGYIQCGELDIVRDLMFARMDANRRFDVFD